MGIGDWGLGIGDWGLGPIPHPQTPIPNTQSPIPKKYIYSIHFIYIKKLKKRDIQYYESFSYLNFLTVQFYLLILGLYP